MKTGALNPAQASELLQRYSAGTETVSAIAAAFGVSIGYPAKLARRRGVSVRRPHASATLKARTADAAWKPQADASLYRAGSAADVRARLLAGEPMLLIAADLDVGLEELVVAARAAR